MPVPDRDDEPEESPVSEQEVRAREEAAWEAIVAAYGEPPQWQSPETDSGSHAGPDSGPESGPDAAADDPGAGPRGVPRHPDHPAGRGRELREGREPWQQEPWESMEAVGGRAPDPQPEPESDLARGEHERFRPPPPPPLPWVSPSRLVAWFGVLGVPAVVLVALLVGVELPSWVGVLLMLWFVGGFCYLVAGMRTDGPDHPDDGAVV